MASFIYVNLDNLYIKSITLKTNQIKYYSIKFTSLAIGFTFVYAILAAFNLLLHYYGLSIENAFIINIFSLSIVLISRNYIYNFLIVVKEELNIFDLLKETKRLKGVLNKSLFIVILIQTFCLCIRLLLPVTHDDQLGQYFAHSLQISRLQTISLIDYYNMGQVLKTDSLASFFDSLTLQLTNSWTLTRICRSIALTMILLTSIEILTNISQKSQLKILLITSIILTLPDICDIGLSGKHDIYICLFEIVGFSLLVLTLRIKNFADKYFILSINIIVAIISTFSRLSSIAYLIISILAISYYLIKGFLIKKELDNSTISIKSKSIIYIISIIIISIIVIPSILNYRYLNNPFYPVSPPNLFAQIFKDPIYSSGYEYFKDIYNLKIDLPIAKNILSVIYACLGLEPIRYVSSKINHISYLYEWLSLIGPKHLMVSYLSLTPFMLIPFIRFKTYNKFNTKILICLFLWLFLWSSGITYTRIIISVCISICVIFLSDDNNSNSNYKLSKLSFSLQGFLYTYGLICIFCFSFWSLTNLYDLPVLQLLNWNQYDRYNLSRDYIAIKNKIRYPEMMVIPSVAFENQWDDINNQNKDEISILFDSPSQFGYFMKNGLLMSSNSKATYQYNKQKNKISCYKLNHEQLISKVPCI